MLYVGTDLIEVERIEKALSERFLEKYYTEKERKLIEKRKIVAASNFAAKEAVAKVFGTGFRGFNPCDIEILRDELGKPYVNLYGGAKELAQKMGIETIAISISNIKEYAQAFAVGQGSDRV